MLKRKVMPVVFVISVFLCTFEVPSAATNCEQAFTFFGFTRAESPSSEHGIFWIGEDVGGECYGSYLIQVYVQEQGIYTSRTLLTEYGEWNWLREDIKHLSRQPFEQLVEKDGVWRCSACTFSVKDPAPDSALARLLNEAFREGGERTWTRDHGVEGILQPLFDGSYTTLTY